MKLTSYKEKEENVKKKEKCEEIKQFSGTNISRKVEVIFFNFDMWSSTYVRQKYINLVEIGAVVWEIQKTEFGNFTVPVNIIHCVCC